MFTLSSCSINVTATSKNDVSSFHTNQTIVSAGKHFSNTNLSDLSIVDLSTECVTKSCDPPDLLIQTCNLSASLRVDCHQINLYPDI